MLHVSEAKAPTWSCAVTDCESCSETQDVTSHIVLFKL